MAMGLDGVEAFADPQHGASLWALAVAPQAAHPGVGEALVRYLAEHYQARGREWMDVSVLHDNEQAIALYDELRLPAHAAFAVKRRNAINEPLFIGGGEALQDLNPYARLLVDEAIRRGIHAEVIDADNGYFRLALGGRSIVCRESLSELTSAVAMSRCQDKRVTLKLLAGEGLSVPRQADADDEAGWQALLAELGAVVVKPVEEGEQGKGISVDLRSAEDVRAAIERARQFCDRVIVEQFCKGEDLRIVVIDHHVWLRQCAARRWWWATGAARCASSSSARALAARCGHRRRVAHPARCRDRAASPRRASRSMPCSGRATPASAQHRQPAHRRHHPRRHHRAAPGAARGRRKGRPRHSTFR